jgi:hypothetical protein
LGKRIASVLSVHASGTDRKRASSRNTREGKVRDQLILNQGFEACRTNVAEAAMPEFVIRPLSRRRNFRLSYSTPTQQSNPVSSHCSVEAGDVVLYERNGVIIDHNAKGMLTSESEDGEEILIEEGNMENIREYYRAQFMSVFHWSELNSAYSRCIDYLAISDANADITGRI